TRTGGLCDIPRAEHLTDGIGRYSTPVGSQQDHVRRRCSKRPPLRRKRQTAFIVPSATNDVVPSNDILRWTVCDLPQQAGSARIVLPPCTVRRVAVARRARV